MIRLLKCEECGTLYKTEISCGGKELKAAALACKYCEKPLDRLNDYDLRTLFRDGAAGCYDWAELMDERRDEDGKLFYIGE